MTVAQLTCLDDHDLVLRVADGDVTAFETIYDRHSAQVFSLAMRVTRRRTTAEEATQDAFLGLWRSARRYDPSRGNLRMWLFSVVRNRAIDLVRRGARHSADVEIDDAIVERLEATDQTDEQVARREESLQARQLLNVLPAAQRHVIELAFFKGMTQTEIATSVGIPLGTVKGRQRLALAKMHRTLTGSGASDGLSGSPARPLGARVSEGLGHRLVKQV